VRAPAGHRGHPCGQGRRAGGTGLRAELLRAV